MNIIIKQKEIEAGIKLFLLQQGIQLNGKATEISFTAGRKDSGLSAEIEINEEGDGYAIIDIMIKQQAPVAPVIVVPEAQPTPILNISTPLVASIATELVAEPFFAPEITVAEASEELVADPVTAAVNKLFEPVEDVLAEDEPEPEAVEEVAAESVEEAAPAIKTVSLFA